MFIGQPNRGTDSVNHNQDSIPTTFAPKSEIADVSADKAQKNNGLLKKFRGLFSSR